MNRRIFLQLSGPAAIIGVLLFAAALGSVWSIQRLQQNITSILKHNVSSLQAALELEINLRKLRFYTLVDAVESTPERRKVIDQAQKQFESALDSARQNVLIQREAELVEAIEKGYFEYRVQLFDDRPANLTNDASGLVKWASLHPIGSLLEPCHELLQLNKSMMEATASESENVSRQTRFAVLLLGILGPISGLIVGYGVTRAWTRSIAKLSVRIHDMHAQLDKDVGDVKLGFGQDWNEVEGQLDRVVERVRETAEQLQRHQREILRAEQLAAVGQLAASVAHEIRNPLTSIKMLIGAALRRPATQKLTEEDMEVMYEEVGRLEQTVQTLLDFGKPVKLRRGAGDLRQIVGQAVSLVRARAAQQNVEISVHSIPESLHCHLDAGQVNNVFVNLFINALDAMPDGGQLTIEIEDDPPDAFRIRVSDTGPGIAPEMVDRLFQPFASNKSTGTGLGLSNCQRIIREHGGTLVHEDRGGSGARFVVTLPKHQEVVHAATVGH